MNRVPWLVSNDRKWSSKGRLDSQFLAISRDEVVRARYRGFQGGELLAHRVQVHRFLFLKGIDISRNVQVVVVFRHLAPVGNVTELRDAFAVSIGRNNAFDMFRADNVLIGPTLKTLAGVDKQDVVGVLTLLLQRDRTPAPYRSWVALTA